MGIYFLSDTHLSPNQPAVYHKFLRYLRSIGKNADELYILGDLFDYWIGDDGSSLLGHNPAIEALAELSDAGVQVSVMHGNRDFLIGPEFIAKIGGTLIPDPTTIELNGQSVLLMHGDSLCTDDVEHQRYRNVVLSPEWQKSILELPVSERLNRALDMRATSEKNKQVKSLSLMDVNQQSVLQTMKQFDVRILIHGHTHRPQIHHFEIDGCEATRYVLGDWGRNNDAVIVVNSEGTINLHHAEI